MQAALSVLSGLVDHVEGENWITHAEVEARS